VKKAKQLEAKSSTKPATKAGCSKQGRGAKQLSDHAASPQEVATTSKSITNNEETPAVEDGTKKRGHKGSKVNADNVSKKTPDNEQVIVKNIKVEKPDEQSESILEETKVTVKGKGRGKRKTTVKTEQTIDTSVAVKKELEDYDDSLDDSSSVTSKQSRKSVGRVSSAGRRRTLDSRPCVMFTGVVDDEGQKVTFIWEKNHSYLKLIAKDNLNYNLI
jgi:hypothetical protein